MKFENPRTLQEAYKLVREFNAPEEAQAILDDPDQPSGTLPHSMEAVLDELARWGQYGHQRVMDPEIADLAVQLADLIKAKQNSQSSSKRVKQSGVAKWTGHGGMSGMKR